MTGRKRLAVWLAGTLLLLAGLVGYRVYLLLHDKDYRDLNTTHIDLIESRLHAKKAFRFVVIGNIRNSMRIFERRIAPLMIEHGPDFMVSVGNAVYDGAEPKYRLLYRGLRKLPFPYLLTAGHNEVEDFGAGKFYRHFGPYFFSFHLRNAVFLFLDSTGETSWKWQIRWLKEELARAEEYPFRFVFLNHSPFLLPGFDPDEPHYVLDEQSGRELRRLLERFGVTAVFSAGYPVFHEQVENGVRYIISGGGGGLLLDRGQPYQFVEVTVTPERVLIENITDRNRLGSLREKLETIKLYVHSLLSMSLFNTLLVLGVISLVALRLYVLILRQEHLYRDFSIDETALSRLPLRVAMFTNNYLPFIGGVPLSIDRLARGLARLGQTVHIFAPEYSQAGADPPDVTVIRCPTLLGFHLSDFPVANIFSRKIRKAFMSAGCDLVHVHHPFWLGSAGMRLARKRGLPVVFTYHTRLERYTHYLPGRGSALKNLVAHAVIKHFAGRCDAIIAPTPSTEEYLRNLGVSALVETIPTGISMEDYECWSPEQVAAMRSRYVPGNELLLISVSRMAREKNLDFLLDALAKVKERNPPPFRCLLVGDGPERNRLEKRVPELGLHEEVVFAGSMSPREVAACYLAADLFVFASTSETQGMVLVEAMAGGCPVVAVRASGVLDVVRHGHNGMMVAESIESWAKTVADLLNDRQRLSFLAENSRIFAKEYSEERIAQRVLKLYRRVVVLQRSKLH
ncbi:MAG: hypothetical protein Kow0089_24650 [Desulfobulbaceae bacterium]